MSQVAVSRRGAVPGLSQAWVALRNQKALFWAVFTLVFGAGAMSVLMAPREFHVLTEVPVAASGDGARTLSDRLSDPENIAAALATLERSEMQPTLAATPSPDGKSVLVEARGSSPQRAGDLINALLRQEETDNKEALLSAADADLADARKQRAATLSAIAAAQAKLTAIEKENAARSERNRKALLANTEAQRRRTQQQQARSRSVAQARSEAQSHARSLEQALDRRKYIGVRIDVLVDEIQGLRARLASTPETVTDVTTRSNAYGQELKLRLEGLLAEREDLIAARGASDPAVKEIESRIRRMRQRAAAEPAETRVENKRPNPVRAMVSSRLRARESELASINAERGQVLSRIATLQSKPPPREPVVAPAPKPVATAALEPILDAGPVRRRLEAAKKKQQEAEAEVQRVAQLRRDLETSQDVTLPSLQYPAPKPLDPRSFLIPLGAALLCSLMAVAAGEIRTRKPAAPTTRLRRRRTIEDRSRELIEGPPAGPETEPGREIEPEPEVEPEPAAEPAVDLLAPQPRSVTEPDTRPTPIPESWAPAPAPLRTREPAPTFVTRPTPIEPLPIPDSGPAVAPEMAVMAPPPAYLRAPESTFVARTTPIQPLPIPDTAAAVLSDMAVMAPPPAYLRASEPTFVARTTPIQPLPIPDTAAAVAPEMTLLAPPLVQAKATELAFVARTTWIEPPLAAPESVPSAAPEMTLLAPPLVRAEVGKATFFGRAIAVEPHLVPEAETLAPPPPVERVTRRIRVVRRKPLEPLVEPDVLSVPLAETIAEAPPAVPIAEAGSTLDSRTLIAVPRGERPTGPLNKVEPVRKWVELTPADLVPEEFVHQPELETDLAREAVFSEQPFAVIEAPAAVAIPAPEPATLPTPRRRAVPKSRTRPKPLRELASLTKNANPLAAAMGPSAVFADAEALNRIREAIELAECRTLLVCGAQRGDGASHTALLLGAHLSSRGWPVVLVDADFRHRSLHRALRVPHLPGFSEFVMELADYREVLQETEFERMATISAGPLLADPTLLLEPMRVDRAIRILRDLGALVIIDGGAALTEVQAELLAPFTDGVLLVSRHGKGGGWTLNKANERLHAVQATVLGLVRNPSRP